eukprot:415216_1
MVLWNSLASFRAILRRAILRRASYSTFRRYKSYYACRARMSRYMNHKHLPTKRMIVGASIAFGLSTPYCFTADAKCTQYSKRPTVLITGCSQGIGRRIAIELARSNKYKLVLLSRNENKLSETMKLCHAVNNGIEIQLIISDITNAKVIESSVKRIGEEFGPLSCLVNNAGTYYGGEIGSKRMDLDRVTQCIDVNLTSTIKLCQYCIPFIRQTKENDPDVHCAIINIGSRAVTLRTCAARDSIYCATKFGLHGFAECLFHDLREYGIKVASIHPGWTNTPLIPPKQGREFDKMIQPVDIAKAVQFVLDCNETVCPIEMVLAPQRQCMPQRKRKKKKKKTNEHPLQSLQIFGNDS